jgi:hypothetical protein
MCAPIEPGPGANAGGQELATVTDDRIINELRMRDWQAAHWLDEDPSLHTVLAWIQSQ